MAKALSDIYKDANTAYQNTQVLPRWTPPDGAYNITLEDVMERAVAGKGDQAGQTGAMIIVTGRVADGDYANKACVVTRGYTLSGFLSGIKAIAELLGGAGTTLADDLEIIKANRGALLICSVSSRTDAKGKTYTDVDVNEAIPPTAAEAAPTA